MKQHCNQPIAASQECLCRPSDSLIVTGEVGTGQLCERAIFLASIGSFSTSVPINFVNRYVQASIGGRVTFIYGGFLVTALTKGRPLEDIDKMFQAQVLV
ncbi:hypothetical protein N7453_010361 [Penicillium expansum]|nr:hypothetical protein N7453_010361 [Penicillium expansum]